IGATGIATGLAGCAASRSSGSTLESQLEEVRSSTEQYSDPKEALAAGFRVAGPVAPGQGWHFINNDRVKAAAKEGLSRSKPQVLTYDRELNLVAVEWAIPADAADGTPDLFADGGADASEEWHTHESYTHVFANGNGRADAPPDLGFDALTTNDNWAAFRPPDTDLASGDEVALRWGVESPDADQGDETRVVDLAATHPALETLHVWVHKENPEGVFNPVHPDVAGGGGHHDG
ncbi:MAG: hypothetical protein ABEJ34_04380, partial [Haloferacaceae archaeon]